MRFHDLSASIAAMHAGKDPLVNGVNDMRRLIVCTVALTAALGSPVGASTTVSISDAEYSWGITTADGQTAGIHYQDSGKLVDRKDGSVVESVGFAHLPSDRSGAVINSDPFVYVYADQKYGNQIGTQKINPYSEVEAQLRYYFTVISDNGDRNAAVPISVSGRYTTAWNLESATKDEAIKNQPIYGQPFIRATYSHQVNSSIFPVTDTLVDRRYDFCPTFNCVSSFSPEEISAFSYSGTALSYGYGAIYMDVYMLVSGVGTASFGLDPVIAIEPSFAALHPEYHVQVSRGINNASAGVPSVPEPATWSMMMAGFGAVGYGVRRKQAKAGCQRA